MTEKTNFAGLTVAAFESRHAEDMARMIQRHGGVPRVSPSLREAPSDNPRQAIDFANHLITGQIDVLIFLTGVGVRQWIAQVERHVDRERLLGAISDVTTIARGPKPVAALRELGVTPTHRVEPPNTWREILTLVDRHCPLANLVVGLQEYGETNTSLIAGLEARGAKVERLHVYDWELPEDTGPLEENVRAIVAGEIDVALFTSASQVAHLLKVAEALDLAEPVRAAFRSIVTCSIGPTTSQMLRGNELPIDLEPDISKMGQLVQTAASHAMELHDRKKQIALRLYEPAEEAPPVAADGPWSDSLFLRACRRQATERTPIWLMRQAGRYMSEYREVRAQTTFLELCKNPRLCSEVMCTAVERLGVDAAIIFSDLLPILEPMGMELEFAQGEGPVIHNPVRAAADVDRVLELESVDSLHFVMETVTQTRADLPSDIPLIGFAGAPFTLASYAIEGGSSRSFLHTKTLMYRDPQAWDALMGRLVRAVTRYLNAQIQSGAQAVQIFDSWVGCLGPDDYRKFVLPHMRRVFNSVSPGAPTIHFGTGNPALLPLMKEAGGDVIGVDWRIRLDDAWRQIGYDRAVQGNLDPLVLLAEQETIRQQAKAILSQAAGRPGHIFNLGHGVLPQTPVENAIALVQAVKELSSR